MCNRMLIKIFKLILLLLLSTDVNCFKMWSNQFYNNLTVTTLYASYKWSHAKDRIKDFHVYTDLKIYSTLKVYW